MKTIRISIFSIILICIGLSELKAQTIEDIDGNVYHSVTIGSQVWMVENLKTTKYRDGSPIPNVSGNTAWGDLSTGAYCNYNNDAAVGNKYGKLYNWYAVNDRRNIAPIGWHVPSDAEWETLLTYVEANLGTSTSTAKALAAAADWTTDTGAGTIGNNLKKNNSSGFTALPGGYRNYPGEFFNIGGHSYWWTSSEASAERAWRRNLFPGSKPPTSAYHRYLYYNSNILYSYDDYEEFGFSVRCIKD